MARLKQAKEEAEKEIAEFRAKMEAEFQRKLVEVPILCRIAPLSILLIHPNTWFLYKPFHFSLSFHRE